MINNLLRPLLLCCIPLASFAQVLLSPDSVAQRWKLLYEQGRIDSIDTRITFSVNYFHYPEKRSFYVVTDTVREADNGWSIGLHIVDPFMEYNQRKTGTWVSYYSNGRVLSKGSYALAAVTVCQAGGPNEHGYNYKSGIWTYWYPDGSKMAEGKYDWVTESWKNSCGPDSLYNAVPDKDWHFFDRRGRKIGMTDSIRALIE